MKAKWLPKAVTISGGVLLVLALVAAGLLAYYLWSCMNSNNAKYRIGNIAGTDGTLCNVAYDGVATFKLAASADNNAALYALVQDTSTAAPSNSWVVTPQAAVTADPNANPPVAGVTGVNQNVPSQSSSWIYVPNYQYVMASNSTDRGNWTFTLRYNIAKSQSAVDSMAKAAPAASATPTGPGVTLTNFAIPGPCVLVNDQRPQQVLYAKDLQTMYLANVKGVTSMSV